MQTSNGNGLPGSQLDAATAQTASGDVIERARCASAQLLRSQHSLVVASVDRGGEPIVSTCPFASDGNDFLVVVSGLAPHGASFERGGVVSIMLLEDEQQVRQPFARHRLTLRCDVCSQHHPDDRHATFEALRLRFGAIATTLESLQDFRAYRLKPLNGRFVMGFGAAFCFDGCDIENMQPIAL